MTCQGPFSSAFSEAFKMTAVEPVPELLSSREEVESILSADGINLRIDDDLDGVTDGTSGSANDTEKLIDALVEASDEGYENLWRYTPENLCTSRWVRRRCSYIAAYILSIRKGNPSLYEDKYHQYLKEFRMVRKGLKHIPRLSPKRSYQPTMSNVIVDQWYGYAKLRTTQELNEGPDDPKQFPDTLAYGYRGWWFVVLLSLQLPWLG